MAPGLRIEGLVEKAHLILFHLDEPSNVVFHHGSESWAVHGSADQTSLKLARQIKLVVLPQYTACKEAEKLAGRLINSTTLRDGDAVGEAPRQLLQGADEALVRALRALLGEWGLG